MDTLTWEEKYLRLRSERDSIALQSQSQDVALRQMKTKFAKLESLFKMKQRSEASANGNGGIVDLGGEDGVVGGRRADKENEVLVTDLYKRNAKLQRENKAMEAKYKTISLTCGKLKRELQLARRRGGTTVAQKSSINTNTKHNNYTHDPSHAHDDFLSPPNTVDPIPISSNLGASKLAEIVEKLRHRLINAEKQLGKLREENTRLRSSSSNYNSSNIENLSDSTYAAARSAGSTYATSSDDEILRLQRDLRETSAKFQLLQTRYDHMDSKAKAQNELQQGSFEQLEEYNRRIRDLRRQLQEAQHDKDVAEQRAGKAEEWEEQVRELGEQNRYLEEQVTRLCEAPFMNAAGGAGGAPRQQVNEERHERQHKQKIEKLQEVAQTHHAALTALQKEADLLRREKEALQKQVDRSDQSTKETSYAQQISRDKSNLFGNMSDLADLGMEDVDMLELERALAIVRRKMDDPTDLDFLERVDDEDLTTVPLLKKRLQMVQVANLSTTRELERAERMLKAQASINRDLHLEVEEAQKRARTEKGSLQAKLEDFEALCVKRLQRIHSLEAQVRQHLYSVGGTGGGSKYRKTPAGLDDVVSDLYDDDDNLLQEISSGDFGPDENLIEVYIVDASLSENLISSSTSTFVLVDFFDYESQATPLTTGLYPRYDFATTYKVTVDDFFMRFLATDSLSVELNKAHNADYLLLARATITLAGLLESSPRILLKRLPLVSTKDGSIAGFVNIEIRMALPITELYRLFLDRHPEERSRIEHAARENSKTEVIRDKDGMGEHVVSKPSNFLCARDEARLSNELRVTVKSSNNLGKNGRRSPSTYVHYQLLGFQDTFTDVVTQSTDPNYNHSFTFPIVTDPKLLRFLSKYKLGLTVFDDASTEDDHNANHEVIGECKLPLISLASGEDIIETVRIYDQHKHETGTLTIEIRWVNALKRPASAGPNALTAPEVDEIMTRFGPDKNGQVNYVNFVRFADPQPAVVAALESFYTFLTMARKEQGITTSDFFDALTDGQKSTIKVPVPLVNEETFVSGLMKMEIGIPPDELAAVFTHVDVKGEGRISAREFVTFAEPPVSSSNMIITEKLRVRCQHMHRAGAAVMLPFQKADATNSGRVTRLQFKECLREMGFQLVDDDFVEGRATRSSITSKNNAKTFKTSKHNNGIEEDEDEVIGGGVNPIDMKAAINERFDDARHRAENSIGNVQSLESDKKRQEFEKRVKELGQQSNAAAASIDFNSASNGLGHDYDYDSEGEGGGNGNGYGNGRQQVRLSKTAPIANAAGGAMKPPTGRASASSTQHQGQGQHQGQQGQLQLQQPQPYETPLRPDMAATHTGISRVSQALESAAYDNNNSNHNYDNYDNADDVMNIIDVEQTLATTCKTFKGAKILPDNLKKSFQTADEQNEGFLIRRRFASCITSNDSMANVDVRVIGSIMEYFKRTTTASMIDYRAFLTFMAFRAPKVSNGVRIMRKMILHASSATTEFTKHDVNGTGYVKRSDFYACLRELGYAYMASSDMDDVAFLFEFYGSRKGEVYYAAFVEYVTMQEAVLELKDVESKLRYAISQRYSSSNGNNRGSGSNSMSPADSLRDAFAQLDVNNNGIIPSQSFSLGLQNLGFNLTTSEMSSLYMRADPKGTGVSYADFVTFITGPEESYVEPSKSISDFDMGLLQLKGYNVVKECMQRLPSLETLSEPFKHYDWRRTGSLPLRPFAAAVRQAGFTFSRAEIVVLASHFGSGKSTKVIVPYTDFLNWCTPSDHTPTPAIGGRVDVEALMGNLRRVAARSENGAYTKWADVFEAADVEGAGFVDEHEVREVLRRLGAKITQSEARVLAVEFGGGKKNAVRYRGLLRVLFPGATKSSVENGKGIAALRRIQAAANRSDLDLPSLTRKAREVFGELDLDGLGYVTKRMFKKGLVRFIGKVRLATPSDNDVDEIMERYDTSGDGSVCWKEFVSESFGGGSMADGAEVEGIARFKTMVRKCVRKGVDYRAAFERLDEGFKGSLSMLDFKSAMQELNSGLTEGEIVALAGKFRSTAANKSSSSVLNNNNNNNNDTSRVVLYLELIHAVTPARTIEWSDPDGWRIEEKLRSMIKNRFEFWVPGKLKKAFRFFDRPTLHGRINIDRFSDGLKRLKAFRISGNMEKVLFDIIDGSGNGYISYADFVCFVRDANVTDVSYKCISDLTKAGVTSNEARKTLSRYDSNDSGLISLNDFKDGMEGLGSTLSKSDCLRLLARFDEEETMSVDIKRFVEFIKRGGRRGDGQDGGIGEGYNDNGGDSDSEGSSEDYSDDDEGRNDRSGSRSNSKPRRSFDADKILKKLKRKVHDASQKGVDGKRSFQFFDANSSGSISLDEFRSGLSKLLKVTLNLKDSQALMERFNGRKVGRIDYKEFMRGVGLDAGEEEDYDGSSGSRSYNDKSRDKSRDRSRGREEEDSDSELDRGRSGRGASRMGERSGSPKKSPVKGERSPTRGSSTNREGNYSDDYNDDNKTSSSNYNTGNNDRDRDRGGIPQNEIKQKIHKEMKRLSKSSSTPPRIKRTFSRLDIEGKDYVSKRDFKSGLESMGFEFDSVVMKGVCGMFEKTRDDGRVYYLLFEKVAMKWNSGDYDNDYGGDGGGGGKSGRNGRGRSGYDNDTDVDDLALMVRKELKRLSRSSSGAPRIKQVFEDLDRSGNGKLNKQEFKRGLTSMGFNFTTSEMDRLMSYLDADGDDRISYKEYVKLVGVDDGQSQNRSRSQSQSRGRDGRGGNDTDVDDLALMVRKELKRLSRSGSGAPRIKQVFEELDRSGNGNLNKREFKRGLTDMGFNFTTSEMDRLMSYLDADGDDRISYKEYIKLIGVDNNSGSSSSYGNNNSSSSYGNNSNSRGRETDVDDLALMVRKELKRLSQSSRGPPRVKKTFNDMDSSNSGKLSKREFQRALTTMGFNFSTSDMERLLGYLDQDGDGYISFKEYLSLLGIDSNSGSSMINSQNKQLIQKELRRITQSSTGPPRVRATFEEVDRNGDGTLSEREFKRALELMNFKLSSSEIRGIVKELDVDGDGSISYSEFERLCTDDGSSSTDSDNYNSKYNNRGRTDSRSSPSKGRRSDSNDSRGGGGRGRSRDGGESDTENESTSITKALQKEFERLTKSSRGPPRIRVIFEKIDRTGNGYIGKREFRNALDELGFRFSESQIKDVLRVVDVDGDGRIDYEEFERICTKRAGGSGERGGNGSERGGERGRGGERSNSKTRLDSSLLRKLRTSQTVKRGTLLNNLQDADNRDTNKLKTREFEEVVKDSFEDVRLSRSEVKEVVEAFDPNGTGKIKYEEFVDAVR